MMKWGNYQYDAKVNKFQRRDFDLMQNTPILCLQYLSYQELISGQIENCFGQGCSTFLFDHHH